MLVGVEAGSQEMGLQQGLETLGAERSRMGKGVEYGDRPKQGRTSQGFLLSGAICGLHPVQSVNPRDRKATIKPSSHSQPRSPSQS